MAKVFLPLYILLQFFQCGKLKESSSSLSVVENLVCKKAEAIGLNIFYFQFSKWIYIRGQRKFLSNALKQGSSLKEKNNWKLHIAIFNEIQISYLETFFLIFNHIASMPQAVHCEVVIILPSPLNVRGKVLPKQSLYNSYFMYNRCKTPSHSPCQNGTVSLEELLTASPFWLSCCFSSVLENIWAELLLLFNS